MYLLESNNSKINEIFKVSFGESLITGNIVTCGRDLRIVSVDNQIFTFRDNINDGFKTSKVLKATTLKEMCYLEVNNKLVPIVLKVFKIQTAHSTYVFLLD